MTRVRVTTDERCEDFAVELYGHTVAVSVDDHTGGEKVARVWSGDGRQILAEGFGKTRALARGALAKALYAQCKKKRASHG